MNKQLLLNELNDKVKVLEEKIKEINLELKTINDEKLKIYIEKKLVSDEIECTYCGYSASKKENPDEAESYNKAIKEGRSWCCGSSGCY